MWRSGYRTTRLFVPMRRFSRTLDRESCDRTERRKRIKHVWFALRNKRLMVHGEISVSVQRRKRTQQMEPVELYLSAKQSKSNWSKIRWVNRWRGCTLVVQYTKVTLYKMSIEWRWGMDRLVWSISFGACDCTVLYASTNRTDSCGQEENIARAAAEINSHGMCRFRCRVLINNDSNTSAAVCDSVWNCGRYLVV